MALRRSKRLGVKASAGVVLAGCFLGAPSVFTENVAFAQGVMPSGTAEPVEARIAVAADPLSTRAWYSLRVEATAGDLGLVLPVPAGTSVDYGLPSFLEALEVASAPRIIPSTAADVTCAASAGQPLVDIAGELAPAQTLAPLETSIVTSVDDVRAWATARGLVIPAALDARLVSVGPSYFVVARFAAPAGLSRTRPLRVVSPSGAATFPLSLVVAGTQDVDVHAFAIGRHRAVFAASPATVDVASLSFDAAARTSNYDDLLAQALGPPGALVTQMSSHPSLRDSVAVDAPFATPIDAVSRTYFERAAATGEATLDPAVCTAQAAVILGQSAHVGTTCARAAFGVAGGAAPCLDDVVDPGEVDPGLLRCGGLADDLAVALSDLEPDEAWLTRGATRVPASNPGADVPVSFPDSVVRLDPIVEAGKLDLSGCGDGGSGAGGAGSGSASGPSGSTGSGPSSSASGGTVVSVPVYAHEGCACDGTWVLVDYVDETESDPPDAYYDESDACAGDTTGTSDTTDTSGYATSDTSCNGDTTSGSAGDTTIDDGCSCDGTSDSSSSDACSGDSSSSDACSGDSSSSDACSGDTSTDGCAVRRAPRASSAPKVRRKKLSVLVYALLAVVVPMRRLTRKKPAPKRKKAPEA